MGKNGSDEANRQMNSPHPSSANQLIVRISPISPKFGLSPEPMTTAALITKLKKKLEKETSKDVLNTIEILLRDDTKDDRVRRRMTEMAIRSEEAIAKGETVPWEEVKADLQRKIDKHRQQRSNAPKRA